MIECNFHPETLEMMEKDEFHQLDTRFLRRKLDSGIKLISRVGEVITVTKTGFTCKDNLLHVAVIGKMGYTFRRIKQGDETVIVIM